MRTATKFFLQTCLAALVAAPACAFADVSNVVQSWRTDGGWLTELRQHADGARVCSSGKAFREEHPFGLSIVESGQIMLVTLVDEQRPPTVGGPMKFVAGDRELGNLSAMTQGPAFATIESQSTATRQLIATLPDRPVSIDVGGRHYRADLTGLTEARQQLQTCMEQAAK